MNRRVVVTGMGCVTPIGCSVDDFQQALFAGHSGVARHVFPDLPDGRAPGLRFTHTAQVKGFQAEDWLTPSQINATERASQMALVAAAQAIKQSRLMDFYAAETTGIVLGCSTGGRSAEEPETAKLYIRDARVHPLTVVRTMASAGASQVAIAHGITGPALNLSTACASGTHAIGLAFHMLSHGMIEAAVCGGHEAPLTFAFLRAWDSMRVISPTQCRPFAADRDGITLGEGAAMLCLETLEAAQARGAEVYGEIVGFGMTTDAKHITQPDVTGPERAMRAALSDGRLTPSDVGYVNAHGTGTVVNDAVEANALRRVFGPNGVPVSSTKTLHGHSIGATGAIEALATILMLREQRLAGTAGVAEAESALGVDLIVGEARKASVDVALSNSLAFGGLNAVLAFRRI